MSENQEAILLATWLSDEPGSPAPNGIDREVMETIYALRPEYAPALQLTINEVFDELMDGPLLDPEIGEALRNWLNGPPGTPPPPILPIGIVEATYALRPDLAPALRFGIEDILGEVKAGPLAGPHVIDLERARPPRRWWFSPALGAVAVAAIALFFVGPLAEKAKEPSNLAHPISLPSEAEADPISTTSIDVAFGEQGTQPEQPKESLSFKAPKTSEGYTPERKGVPRPVAVPPPPRSAPTAAPPAPPSISEPPTVLPEPTAVIDSTEVSSGTHSDSELDKESSFEFRDRPSEDRQNRSRRRKGNGSSLDSAPGRALPKAATESTDSEQEASPPMVARPLRLNPTLAALEQQSEQAIHDGRFDEALAAIEAALLISERTRFDTARLWRTKAKILTLMGRETDAQHARETAAKLDPTR